MYTFSSKLKLTAIILIIVGAVGLIYGFISVPSNQEELKEILAAEAHGSHDESHEDAAVMQSENHEVNSHESIQHSEVSSHESNAEHSESAHAEEGHHESHMEHVLHQFQTKPWSALFVSAFFFFMIALGAMVFYAIQNVAQAGWSPVLFRVIEGITAYLLPGSIIVVLIVLLAGTHFYPWQNHELVAEDKILQAKSGYLNFPFFLIRAIIYLIGWNVYRFFMRKTSLDQDSDTGTGSYKKLYKGSIVFLVFFVLTEAMMGWDWFMSMTPHWYSTLFSWYIFASLFVSAITVISLVTIFLKKLGHLEFVNDSHLHDLSKFMFAFSIFWTYLWFSQFLLIWYANIPEEAAYFVMRIGEYKLLFFGMLLLNFIFPILMLINSDYKRIPWFVVMAGVMILVGHYVDIFLLVMPSTVGPHWSFGITEICSILFFLGLFIFFVGTGLSKAPLHPKGNPFLKESENYHY